MTDIIFKLNLMLIVLHKLIIKAKMGEIHLVIMEIVQRIDISQRENNGQVYEMLLSLRHFIPWVGL